MPLSSRLPALPALVLLLALSLLSTAAMADTASISTSSCSTSGNVLNNLKGIPRLNAKGKVISSDLGSYTWYTCTAANSTNCDWYNPFDGGVQIDSFYGTAPSEQSPVNAIQGYGVLIAFAVVMAVLSIVIGLSLCIGRYCCCCIRGGTCGKRWPTIKTRCCGIQPNLVTGQMEYSSRERWCARGYMWVFVIFTVVWILMSYLAGTGSIPSSMKAIANAPEPLIETLQGVALPVRDLIVDLSTQTLTTLVHSVTAAIANTTDLNALVANMTCIINLTSPGHLPNVTLLSNIITLLANNVGAINSTLASTGAVLANVNAQIANVSSGIGGIGNATTLMGGALTAGVQSMLAINGSLMVLAALSANITDPNSGVPSITRDLNGAATTLPNSTASSDASQGLGDMAGTSTYTYSQTGRVQGLLQSINASYANQSDYSKTATHLNALQADVTYINQLDLFTTLNNQVGATQYAIGNISSAIVATNTSINGVIWAVQHFNFSGPTGLLLAINASTSQLPRVFALLLQQLGLVQPLFGVLPCFYAAVGAAEAFNVTLIQLPAEFNTLTTLGPTLNSTLTEAAVTAVQVQGEIATVSVQIANFNVTFYLQQIATMSALAANQTAALVSGPTMGLINNAYAQTQAANFSSVGQLLTLNSTMNSITFNATLVTVLNQLENSIKSAESLMSVIVPDLMQINTYGYCTVNGAQCKVNADCTSSSCLSSPTQNPGTVPTVKRCALVGTTPCAAHGDSDCGAGDHCLVDPYRYAYLRSNITFIQYAAPDSSEVTPLLTQLNAVLAQADPNTNGLSAVTNTIDTTVTTLTTIDLSAVNTTLQQLASSLTTFDTSSIQSQVTGVQAAIASVDLASARATVDSLASSIDDVESNIADLIQAQRLVQSIRDLLATELPMYLDAINKPNLLSLYNSGGLTAMAQAVLQLVDNATLFINNSQFLEPTNLTGSLLTTDIKHYLDVLSTPAYSQYGPVYFIAMLAYKDKTLDLSTYPASQLSHFDQDVNGHAYANDAYCLSSNCIDTTIDYYASSDLKTLSSGSIPVGLSAIHALSIPLIFPAIIAILGLLSSLCYKSAAWASCCSSCTACMIFVVMPIIFLLAGIVWPLMVLGVSDACRGGASIGNQYIRAQAPSICTDTLSGTITANQQCYISPATNVSLTFDIAAVYASIAGSSCSAQNDPLGSIFTQLTSTVSSYPLDKVDDAIDNINSGSSAIQIRPALINLARTAATSSGALFTGAVGAVGDRLGCGALSATFEDVKSSLCCTTATTFYWAIGAWYLMAFTMLCCGWQAALLGRKRFAGQIWGPAEVVPLVNGDALSQTNISSAPAAFTADKEAPEQPPAAYEPNPSYQQPTADVNATQPYDDQQPTAEHYEPHTHQQHAQQPSYMYEAQVPGLAEEQSIVDSKAGSRVASRRASKQASRQPSRQGSRQGSRANSRRPSEVRTDAYPAVVLHGASNYGTMESEGASPIIHTSQHADLSNVGNSMYTAMYPTLDRSSSAASEPEQYQYQQQQPDLSPDYRNQHLLQGYPDQSPQPNTPSVQPDEE